MTLPITMMLVPSLTILWLHNEEALLLAILAALIATLEPYSGNLSAWTALSLTPFRYATAEPSSLPASIPLPKPSEHTPTPSIHISLLPCSINRAALISYLKQRSDCPSESYGLCRTYSSSNPYLAALL